MVGRILIVDDDAEACEFFSEYFKMKGYDTLTAFNGTQGVAAVSEFDPHVVLLDVLMPTMDGIDALKLIHAEKPKLAIIMITAVQDMETVREAIQAGAHDYIIKPMDLDYLDGVVMTKVKEVLPE